MAFHYSPKIVSNGLIFKLDAANNKSFPKSGTEFKDLTRKKAASVLVNGPTFNTDKAGNIVFDGVTTDTSLWYNLVGVYIPSTSITTYLNGNQIFQNTTSIPASQYVGNPSNTRINKDGGTNSQAGSVADVSIYDIALTPTQILKNYNATKSRFGL